MNFLLFRNGHFKASQLTRQESWNPGRNTFPGDWDRVDEHHDCLEPLHTVQLLECDVLEAEAHLVLTPIAIALFSSMGVLPIVLVNGIPLQLKRIHDTLFNSHFLAPSRAQGVTLSVCPAQVCLKH